MKRGFKSRKKVTVPDKFFTKEDIFLSRMASILQMPKGKVHSMFRARALSTIRLNSLAGDPSKIYTRLKSKGLELEKVHWSPDTYIVTNRDKSKLGEMEEYEKGLFYIQNLSSMLPSLILDPQTDDQVLDLCAAPGSKTTHLADLMNNSGEIIANDDNFSRLRKLKEVLDMFHVKNTKVNISDGRHIGGQMKERFDRVLLDAPCSGEGLIYLSAPKPLRFWSIKKVKIMTKTQKELIESAFKALKKGGSMVYSTCTLEPDENEGIVTHLLNRYPDAQIESIDLIKDDKFKPFQQFTKKGITHWSSNNYHPEVAKCIRILPSAQMQGFFLAKITKAK